MVYNLSKLTLACLVSPIAALNLEMVFSSSTISENMVLLAMIIGSFLMVGLCLVLVIVIHCFNIRELNGLRKFNRKTYRVRRSIQSATVNYIKEESTFISNRHSAEWNRVDLPIDARSHAPMPENTNFDLTTTLKSSYKYFYNPEYGLSDSYASFAGSDKWTAV